MNLIENCMKNFKDFEELKDKLLAENEKKVNEFIEKAPIEVCVGIDKNGVLVQNLNRSEALYTATFNGKTGKLMFFVDDGHPLDSTRLICSIDISELEVVSRFLRCFTSEKGIEGD